MLSGAFGVFLGREKFIYLHICTKKFIYPKIKTRDKVIFLLLNNNKIQKYFYFFILFSFLNIKYQMRSFLTDQKPKKRRREFHLLIFLI